MEGRTAELSQCSAVLLRDAGVFVKSGLGKSLGLKLDGLPLPDRGADRLGKREDFKKINWRAKKL